MASNSISKSVFWQLGGKIALQGIAFFTTPIFTRLLTPADYGYTALYTSWLSILCLIEGLQVHGSIGYARIEYGKDILPEYLSSVMSVSFLSFIVILLFSIVFNKLLSSFMGLSSYLVILVVIHSFFTFVINFEVARLDQLKKVEKSALLSLSQSLAVLLCSLLLVFNANNKADAKIYGQAFPVFLFGLVILINLYKKGKTLWNKEYIKSCLTLTLPLILHGIGGVIFAQSDRIMLQKIQGESVLGIYSVSLGLCSVLTIIYGATNVAWAPFYLDYKKQNNKNEILIHSKRYLKFFTLISIGFILLSYDVYKLMAPSEYYGGMRIIPLLVLSNFFGFVYLFPVNYEFYRKKTKLIPLATLLAALINIIINKILIPVYGILGAAIGTLVAHILLYFLHEIMARLVGGADYEYQNIRMFLFPLGVMIIICALFFFVSLDFFVIRWIVALFLAGWIIRDFVNFKSIF